VCNKVTKNLYFLCSPNLGILENWLPVLYKLKLTKANIKLICIFPKTAIVQSVNLNDVLIKISEDVFDELIFPTNSGTWVSTPTLVNSIDITKNPDWFKYVLKFNLKFSDLFIGRFSKSMSRVFFSFYERNIKNISGVESVYELVQDPDALLFDINESSKEFNLQLFQRFQGIKKFTMHHGISIFEQKDSAVQVKVLDLSNITSYVFSQSEYVYCKDKYQISEGSIKVVGIPRYDKDWIAIIEEQQKNKISKRHWENFVFVVSRPISDYLPRERKISSLVMIKGFCDKYDLKIIIKRHPKESGDGTFEYVFGSGEYGESWMYSDDHPVHLGKLSEISIVFYSSLVVDLVVAGVPTIELLNLKGLSKYDTKDALKVNGEPVFDYRYYGLVFGASNSIELSKYFNDFLIQKETGTDRLMKNYNKIFTTDLNSSRKVANDILSKTS
jgi:hypothetical protein